jgi:TusA-related sulfurtransferase
MIDLTQKLTGVVRTIKASIRADDTMSKAEAVTVYLDIDYSDCTIEDTLQWTNADRKIAAVVPLRKAFASLKPGQHIKVKASSPGAQHTDPKVQLRAEVEGMSDEEATKYLLAKVRELRS